MGSVFDGRNPIGRTFQIDQLPGKPRPAYQIVGFALETGLWGPAVLYSLYCAVFSFVAWVPALVWACFTVWRTDWIFHTPHFATAGVPGSAERHLRAR